MDGTHIGPDGEGMATEPEYTLPPVRAIVEGSIFGLRWSLVISYLTLGLLTVAYLARLIWESVRGSWDILVGKSEGGVLTVLAGLDAVMVANVAYLILAGSYIVFVRGKISDRVFKTAAERPPAFQHLTPNSLKKKMAGSLVGVSSVNLIQVLLEGDVTYQVLIIKVSIHLVLLVGFICFAWADVMESKESEMEHKEAEHA